MNWLLIIIVLLLALCVVNGYRKVIFAVVPGAGLALLQSIGGEVPEVMELVPRI